MKALLSGNEAVARGAWEGGVACAYGYPGTPSTEILEALVKLPGSYAEWSPNEKVALEAAAGSAIAGVRSIVTMKLVGLNVAADPLMTLSYIGVRAGLVIVVADDFGQYSSQTEQDTRHYARLAKVPVLEPADAVECREFTLRAFEISEQYGCPVILRTTTCVAHSRFSVECGERTERARLPFERRPQQFVPIPVWGRVLRRKLEERVAEQSAAGSADAGLNKIYARAGKLKIVSSGSAALHALEIFPDADILKLGWSWPFPDELLKRFAAGAERLLVIEEGDPILEEHLQSLNLPAVGKALVPRTGELTPARILEVRCKLEGRPSPLPAPVAESADLPGRPPILCAGCPHRGIFFGLAQFDVIVTGDIGCYTLGVFPPLSRTDTVLCMGGGFTVAQGFAHAGETRPVAGIVGDSTFFHSGITGLLNAVYNRANVTLIVADNRTTAMTGHQEHPGTGKNLLGDIAPAADIETIARACGMNRVRTVNPYDLAAVHTALEEELFRDEPSLIISRAPCPLKERKPVGPALTIDPARCRRCKACLKLGCPAIECAEKDAPPTINAALCAGCDLCRQVCKFGAVNPGTEPR